MTCRTAALLLAGLLAASCTQQPVAQAAPKDSESSSPSDTPATSAYRTASTAMHGGMEIDYTGDPDVDFLKGMIPHHQGAVDMARIEIEHGRDPKVKAFARRIVDAQQAEIDQMKAWLKERGAKADAAAGPARDAHKGHQ